MRFFRINIYLTIKYFFFSLFSSHKKITNKINKYLKFYSNKNEIILTSQLRVGFKLVLNYLKEKNPKKNEIIVNSYNLAEMINICQNTNLKVKYAKLNNNLFIDENDLKKKINKKTLAVLVTNIFNTYDSSIKIKSICNKRKIPLIEDNAIYFGNFKKIKKKKIYAGSFGDYILNSFNIMKNISGMYGGSVATNDKKFALYANVKISKYKNFPIIKYFKQCLIFLILKILSNNFIYNIFFFNILKKANISQNRFILGIIYPSIKFKKTSLPDYYYSKINSFSKKMIYYQLSDNINFNNNHIKKKLNNIFYHKILNKKKINGIELLKYEDPNFQNYNDYPIIVERKKALVNYLFSKGIETKTVQYVDCQKIFKSKKSNELKNYENKILCLPNHKLISKKYIMFIVNNLEKFYKNK